MWEIYQGPVSQRHLKAEMSLARRFTRPFYTGRQQCLLLVLRAEGLTRFTRQSALTAGRRCDERQTWSAPTESQWSGGRKSTKGRENLNEMIS